MSRRPHLLPKRASFGLKGSGRPRDTTTAGLRAITSILHSPERIGLIRTMTAIPKDGSTTKATGDGKTTITTMGMLTDGIGTGTTITTTTAIITATIIRTNDRNSLPSLHFLSAGFGTLPIGESFEDFAETG
jgi:hypothetical protein